MKVFRISKNYYINDLSGSGARLYGGRWNHKGCSVIYTAMSRALATVEYLVHVPYQLMPQNLSICCINIFDAISLQEIQADTLPDNWKSNPPPISMADIGTNWVKSNKSLMLKVPSAVVDGEFNILINHCHKDMKYVSISDIKNYYYR